MASGVGSLRLANFAPGSSLDVCVRPPGQFSFEGPLFHCAKGGGVAYTTVTRAFPQPAGGLTVRLVPAGDSCANPLASNSLEMDKHDSFVAVALGGGDTGIPYALTVLRNDTIHPVDGTVKLRFVHAIHGAFPLDCGTISDGVLSPSYFNVPFGGVPADGHPPNGFIFRHGYARGVGVNEGIAVGAAKAGDTAPIYAKMGKLVPGNSNLTGYGFGILGDPAWPVGVMLCHDLENDGNHQPCEEAPPAP